MHRHSLIGLISILFTGSGFAADSVTITMPCSRAPFPTCQETSNLLLNGGILPGGTTQKLNGFNALVKQMADDIYAGQTRTDSTLLGGTSTAGANCTTVQPAGPPPICPVLPITENGCKDEMMTTNFKGDKCPKISKVGIAAAGQYYYTLGAQSSGTLETANIGGGMILALYNQASPISMEISKNKLTIGVTSGCNAQAVALQNLITQQTDVKLLDEVSRCDVSQTDICSTRKYFQANLATIDSAYALLVQCRLSEEVASKFRTYALDYPKQIENAVLKPCFSQFGGDVTALRQCYYNHYQGWIRNLSKTLFPVVAAECH